MSETTNTSESVDVLAVLRVAEAYCYDAGAANAARNVKEARAAIAELTAEAEALVERMGWDETHPFAAALSRCGGAK